MHIDISSLKCPFLSKLLIASYSFSFSATSLYQLFLSLKAQYYKIGTSSGKRAVLSKKGIVPLWLSTDAFEIAKVHGLLLIPAVAELPDV